jgi:chromosome partitioning protein
MQGMRTLLVDVDCQGSIGTILRLRPEHYLADFLIRQFDLSVCTSAVCLNLDVMCSDRRTADAERHVANEIARERVFENSLGQYDADYQAVVLDVGPSVNQLQTAAMVYARHILVPVNMDLVSVSGAAACVQFCSMLSTALRTQVRPVAFLPTMVDKRIGMTRIVQGLLGELSAHFQIPILPEIRTDATVGKATQAGQFLHDYDPDCKAMNDYAAACDRLMEILDYGKSATQSTSITTQP